MKLYDPITKYSIINEVWRICGANANIYIIRDIVARVNAALDRYCHLAFKADGKHRFDDINETSPPIDTQDIASGTNRYKFSAFTEKIINLIKLTVLNADAVEIPLIQERIENLPDAFTQIYKSTDTGVPSHYLKYGDFIYLRPYPDYDETGGLRAYFNRPASKFEFLAATISQASPGVLTDVAHGLVADDTIMLETDGALPTGLVVDTVYYVKEALTADTFTLALTLGGTAINTSAAGSGIHYYVETSKVPGIPVIHHSYLARHASLPFLIDKKLQNREDIKKLIGSDNPRSRYYGGDELEIIEHFAHRNKDVRNKMTNRGVLPR